jgi:hypothetical protein
MRQLLLVARTRNQEDGLLHRPSVCVSVALPSLQLPEEAGPSEALKRSEDPAMFSPPVEHLGCRNRARPNRSTPWEISPERDREGPGVSPTPGQVSCDARALSDLGRFGRLHRRISRWKGPQMLTFTHLEGCQSVREPSFPNPSSPRCPTSAFVFRLKSCRAHRGWRR